MSKEQTQLIRDFLNKSDEIIDLCDASHIVTELDVDLLDWLNEVDWRSKTTESLFAEWKQAVESEKLLKFYSEVRNVDLSKAYCDDEIGESLWSFMSEGMFFGTGNPAPEDMLDQWIQEVE